MFQKIKEKLIVIYRFSLFAILILFHGEIAFAQSAATVQAVSKPRVHLVVMGGNDCPPCVAWRQFELPKLQKTEVFNAVTFDYVTKGIRSSVPSSIFLPANVKPYKELLDIANAGNPGSPQVALLVDGKVYDYYFGTRTAEVVEKMLLAASNGTPYPMEKRCLELQKNLVRSCAKPA